MTIKLLSPNLVNQIAAGEVLERPASAVKELVENSIDAGATHVDVVMRDGGRTFLSVTDNGCGMTQAELELAVQRHATSKLPDNDLWNINTLGFRGEALPSIGSVSRLTLTSQKQHAEEAWSLLIEGGQQHTSEPTAFRPGTRIEVRDLFYATPARLKFLKMPATEIQHTLDMLNRLSMATPQVGISLSHDGKTLIDYVAQTTNHTGQLERLKEVMGREFADNSCVVESERDGLKLSGYAGLPTLNRGTGSHMYVFVNGRPVKDKLLNSAVRAAYKDFLAKDRFPFVSLFLDCPPEAVDVNVHPTKSEVRFRDTGSVRGMIVGSIKHALNQAGHRASTTVAQEALGAMSAPAPAYYQPSLKPIPGYTYGATNPAPAPNFHEPSSATPNYGSVAPGSMDFELPSAKTFDTPVADTQQTSYPLGAPCAQVHETYIVAQNEDGIVIVDQHAAHERLVYEEMKRSLQAGHVQTQPLLIPEVVELPTHQLQVLTSKLDDLASFGLVLEPFGNGAVLVREIPCFLEDTNYRQLVTDVADELSEYDASTSLKDKIHEVCSTMACHGSIRSGKKMTPPEMSALLRQMEATPHSGQCNHGRPTYVDLKLKDIEKLFGRR